VTSIKDIYHNFKPWIWLAIADIFVLWNALSGWNYYDVQYFIEWANVAWKYGILYVYQFCDKVAYPPIPVLLFVGLYTLAITLGNNTILTLLVLKIPLIIAFNLIYVLLVKRDSLTAGKLWLISYASYTTIFGYQFDLIMVLLLLLVYFEIISPKGSPWRAGLWMALAILVKHGIALLGFIPLLEYLKNKDYRSTRNYLIAGIVTGLMFTVPFLIVAPYSFIYKILLFHENRYPQDLSLWAIPLYVTNYDYARLPCIITWIWLPIYILVYSVFLLSLYRIRLSRERYIYAFVAGLVITLVLNKVGNLNYYVWILPFLAIMLPRISNRFLTVLYVAIPFLIMGAYPAMIMYVPAVVHGSVFITEDLSYYSAIWFIDRSFAPVMGGRVISFIEFLRNYYDFFKMLYVNTWLSSIIFTLIYNLYLFMFLRESFVKMGLSIEETFQFFKFSRKQSSRRAQLLLHH